LPSAEAAPWTAAADGLAIRIRLTPRGGRDAFDGVEALADGARVLKARVRAAPENGRANAALIDLVAGLLRAPKRAVTIRSGETGRIKQIFVAGPPAPYLDALARLAPMDG
jgi:uncharacterized protein YggU (UPF0235/DUF167 family)